MRKTSHANNQDERHPALRKLIPPPGAVVLPIIGRTPIPIVPRTVRVMAIFVQVDIVIALPSLRDREALVPPQVMSRLGSNRQASGQRPWTPFPPFVVHGRDDQHPELRRPLNASHAARCVACQGVRSYPVPVALVGECSIPVV